MQGACVAGNCTCLLQGEVLHIVPEREAPRQQLVGQHAHAPQVRLRPILLRPEQNPAVRTLVQDGKAAARHSHKSANGKQVLGQSVLQSA